jgi:hypothetical protein
MSKLTRADIFIQVLRELVEEEYERRSARKRLRNRTNFQRFLQAFPVYLEETSDSPESKPRSRQSWLASISQLQAD